MRHTGVPSYGAGVARTPATPAIAALLVAGTEHRVHSYPHDPRSGSWGEDAVAALGVAAARVLKTLVVTVGPGLAVAVLAVPEQLDVKAAATALGAKHARLADARDVQRATGYVLGGVSPLGQRRPLPTVLDTAALAHDTVFCSAGRRGLEVELAPADLARLTGAVTASITRG